MWKSLVVSMGTLTGKTKRHHPEAARLYGLVGVLSADLSSCGASDEPSISTTEKVKYVMLCQNSQLIKESITAYNSA